MNCLNCDKELSVTKGQKPKKYCNDSCKMAFYRRNRNEELEESNAEEEKLREVVIAGESPNARSSREYGEFQKEWIKGSCDEYEMMDSLILKLGVVCKKCEKPHLRHHEARYVVQHGNLL